jgi:poly-gamma-glutamate synthesis protein (capsule biosynthesis protein)
MRQVRRVSVRLLLGGDVMTGRGIDQVLPLPGSPRLFERWVSDARDYVRLAERAHGPIEPPLSPAAIWGDALAQMDHWSDAVRILNLETAVTASDDAWPGKGIHYRMHPRNVDCLIAARLAVCCLANNHVLDWGRVGLEETLVTLSQAGLKTVGAGLDDVAAHTPAELPMAAGARVLVSAWATQSSGVPVDWAAGPGRPGVALLPDLSERTAAHVAHVMTRNPGDIGLVSLHWGENWGLELPRAHRAFAHRLIELGAADVVHGHSSHHPLPIEVYRGRAILYGCGDLINDYEGIAPHGSLRSDVACLYLLALADDGALQSLRIIPLQLRRFRLERADRAARNWLRRVFEDEGKPLRTGLERGADGAFELRWG